MPGERHPDPDQPVVSRKRDQQGQERFGQPQQRDPQQNHLNFKRETAPKLPKPRAT